MTPAQDEAVNKAWGILTEHFDRVLLVVDFELPDAQRYYRECWWHGGSVASIGMASYAHDRLLRGGTRNNEP